MDTTIAQYLVHQCPQCPRETEYFCASCERDLCPQCSESHVINLISIDQNIVVYCEKLEDINIKRPNNIFRKNFEPSEDPLCFNCARHNDHRRLDIRAQFESKRAIIHIIKCEAIYYREVLKNKIMSEKDTIQQHSIVIQSEILRKLKNLNQRLERVLKKPNFIHRCLDQKRQMFKQICSALRYEHTYQQSGNTPVQFLLFTKKNPLYKTKFKPCLMLHRSLVLIEHSYIEEKIESLFNVYVEKLKRQIGIEHFLQLTSKPTVHQSLKVAGVRCCHHISCVTTSQVFVNDKKCFSLTDTLGATLHQLANSNSELYSDFGSHTTNSAGDFIYIHKTFNIYKLSRDLKTSSTVIERTKSPWIPRCIHWSRITGNLIVGMCRYGKDTHAGIVNRYNQTGNLSQTIPSDSTTGQLFCEPRYITENNNGDVVVSDSVAQIVVVTERGGGYRFSYKGHPPGSKLSPWGICTDALSHILVCDYLTQTVQMIDKDGQFMLNLLSRPLGILSPHSLCYDATTHSLWVGSHNNNNVSVYRYITRRGYLPEQTLSRTDVMEPLQESLNRDEKKPNEELVCLPQLKYDQKVTVTDLQGCRHILIAAKNFIFASDYNNIIVSNREGNTTHHIKNVCSALLNCYGVHTVNNESELIYIYKNFLIQKISADMDKTTTFIKECPLSPTCVYWTSSTDDLLVGMADKDQMIGMVARYNQIGALTQTITDNNGLALYSQPSYITENGNGDIIVSDLPSGALVVTGRDGIYRFSYTGRPFGSELQPRGICTDALLHILLCDSKSNTVQLINKDGKFLSYLLTISKEIGSPYSLYYEADTHCLWVGSEENNKICIFRYITEQHNESDPSHDWTRREFCESRSPAVHNEDNPALVLDA